MIIIVLVIFGFLIAEIQWTSYYSALVKNAERNRKLNYGYRSLYLFIINNPIILKYYFFSLNLYYNFTIQFCLLFHLLMNLNKSFVINTSTRNEGTKEVINICDIKKKKHHICGFL